VEKAKKDAQEIFDNFDLDKSGYIDAAEVEAFLRKFNETNNTIFLTEEHIKALGAVSICYTLSSPMHSCLVGVVPTHPIAFCTLVFPTRDHSPSPSERHPS